MNLKRIKMDHGTVRELPAVGAFGRSGTRR